MPKSLVKAYLPEQLHSHLAYEAAQRKISVSALVTEALVNHSLYWLPLPLDPSTLLDGQMEAFPSIDAADNARN